MTTLASNKVRRVEFICFNYNCEKIKLLVDQYGYDLVNITGNDGDDAQLIHNTIAVMMCKSLHEAGKLHLGNYSGNTWAPWEAYKSWSWRRLVQVNTDFHSVAENLDRRLQITEKGTIGPHKTILIAECKGLVLELVSRVWRGLFCYTLHPRYCGPGIGG